MTTRRWFRWSLWTLFVAMAVAACWVGYSLRWIRARDDLFHRHTAIIKDQLPPESSDVEVYSDAPPSLPLSVKMLSLFGESPRQTIFLTIVHDDADKSSYRGEQELRDARKLFPESQIIWKLVKAQN
jgi:hypothetical protein